MSNNAGLQAIRRTRTGLPVAARALHVLHASMYDAWAAHDDLAFGTRLGDELRRPPADRTPEAKREAASFAAHLALADLFPTEASTLAKLMRDLGYNPDAVGPEGSPSAIGLQAARAVLALRHGDGANQLGDLEPEPRGLAVAYYDWTGYRPANPLARLADPDRWQPLPTPDGLGQRFLVPHWGLVAPFALEAGWELRPRMGPRRHPGRSYLFQATQVLADSAGLTDEHKAIAEHWADGPGSETPPGHWCLHAQHVSARDGHGLDQDVKLFFALTGALLDASIACWDAKRFFDSVRPVTAVHFLFAGQEVEARGGPGQGTRRIRGETWQPYIPTPPLPEFPSGHSTFTAAADQAGRSRRYGGIHFTDGDLVGRAVGCMVGARVWEAAAALFAGRRPRAGRPPEFAQARSPSGSSGRSRAAAARPRSRPDRYRVSMLLTCSGERAAGGDGGSPGWPVAARSGARLVCGARLGRGWSSVGARSVT
jgi:Domain of unknown function (DUF6851)/VCPO second helical-bundle domain